MVIVAVSVLVARSALATPHKLGCLLDHLRISHCNCLLEVHLHLPDCDGSAV